MNNPIVEGTVFKNDWIHYKRMRNLKEYECIIAYCDPSFKGTSKNDYKAIAVVGKIKNEYHLLKSFVRQCSISEMVNWYYDTYDDFTRNKNAALQVWMEVVFIQDLIFEDFQKEGNLRGWQLPLRPDRRAKPDKFLRIESISPYFERGEFFVNEDEKENPDMMRAIEQLLSIEKGSNTADDFPDALEAAVFLAQKQTRNYGETKVKFVARTRKNTY
jgi:phage terminase large subunit-like protein